MVIEKNVLQSLLKNVCAKDNKQTRLLWKSSQFTLCTIYSAFLVSLPQLNDF